MSPRQRTFGIFLVLASLHLALLSVVGFTSWLADTPFEAFGVTALAVPYLLHHLGLPTLANAGLSGGGWPSPNIFGWLTSILFWAGLYCLVAKLLARLTSRLTGPGR